MRRLQSHARVAHVLQLGQPARRRYRRLAGIHVRGVSLELSMSFSWDSTLGSWSCRLDARESSIGARGSCLGARKSWLHARESRVGAVESWLGTWERRLGGAQRRRAIGFLALVFLLGDRVASGVFFVFVVHRTEVQSGTTAERRRGFVALEVFGAVERRNMNTTVATARRAADAMPVGVRKKPQVTNCIMLRSWSSLELREAGGAWKRLGSFGSSVLTGGQIRE